MKKFLLPLFLLVLALGACRKDSLNSNTIIDSPIPKEFVKATVYGTVIDENNQPVADATVEIATNTGSVTRNTDKNGAFILHDAIVNAKGTYVKVDKAGFFHGSKVINPRLGSRTPVTVMLLGNTATKFIAAVSGGTADYGDYTIALPANSVVDANGNPYNGQIGVAAHYLEPSSREFGLTAPGRLEGYTTTEDVVGLISLGQMAVELRSSNGDLLQLKQGAEATLRIKVAQSSQSLAKPTLPMWYFDEAVGIWVEDGSSTYDNGWYEAKVSHFTFWNWDFISPSALIDFKFVDSSGNPVTNVYLDVQATVSHTHGSGTPDADGHLIGNVPAGEPLVANVYFGTGGGCAQQLILTQNIGPFPASTTAQQVCFTISQSNSSATNFIINGRLLDCAGAPVANGYVRVSTLGGIYPTDANGYYSANILTCQTVSSISLYGIDVTALKESDPVTVAVAGSGTYTVPDITVCTNLTEYFTLTDSTGTTLTYPEVWAYRDSTATGFNGTSVFVEGVNNQPIVSFTLEVNNGLTTYTPLDFRVIGAFGTYSCKVSCTDMVVTITEYGGPGGYIAGTYTGRLPHVQIPGETKPFSGNFRAKID